MQETEHFGISSGTTYNIFISNPAPDDDPLAFCNLTRTQHENFQRPPNVFMQPESNSVFVNLTYTNASTLCNQSEIRTSPHASTHPSPFTEAFHSTNYVLFSMGISRRAPLRGELRRFYRVSTLLYHIFLLFVTRATVTGWPPPKERVC